MRGKRMDYLTKDHEEQYNREKKQSFQQIALEQPDIHMQKKKKKKKIYTKTLRSSQFKMDHKMQNYDILRR